MYKEQKSYEPLGQEMEEEQNPHILLPLNVVCKLFLPVSLAFILFVSIIIITFITASPNGKMTSVIFVFRDAGEYFSLMPFLLTLQKQQANNFLVSGIIINGGTAPADASIENKNIFMLSSFFPNLNTKKLMERNQTFYQANEFVKLIIKKQEEDNHQKEINRFVIISGLVSKAQIDIIKNFKIVYNNNNKFATIGYDDGFNNWNKNTWGHKAMTTTITIQTTSDGEKYQKDKHRSIFDKLWVNANSIKQEATKAIMIPSLKSQVEIEVVGDSSFLQWEKATKKDILFYKNVRKYMYGNNEETCFGILYFGGYGKGYYESVQLFANVVGNITKQYNQKITTFFCFSFVAHPGARFNTRKEEEIFKNAGANNVKILSRSEYATSIYAKASNATLSQGSSCGPQSISIGIPSLFTESSNNIFQTEGILAIGNNFTALKTWFYKMKATNGQLPGGESHDGATILKDLGIPSDPIARCMEYL